MRDDQSAPTSESLRKEVLRARSEAHSEAEEGQDVKDRFIFLIEPEDESFPTEQPAEGLVEPDMEAAGIEPASRSHPKHHISRDFLWATNVAGYGMQVQRDGKHLNFHVFDWEEGMWRFEPISSALPKLEALVKAARLAQEDEDGRS